MRRVENSLRTSVQQRRREGLGQAVVLVWVLIALASLSPARRWALFRVPQSWAYDQAVQWRAPLDVSRFLIIGIDERSMMPSHLGRFPWPRAAYGKLLGRLGRAKAVGFDVLLAEPDGLNPASDRAFAAALRLHGRAVLAMHVARQVEVGGGMAAAAARRALPAVDLPFRAWKVRAVQVTPPLALLGDAAAGAGFVDLQADPDGIVRRAPLVLTDDEGHVFPHFAVELARVATGATREELARRLSARPLEGFGPPLRPDAGGSLLIAYPGPSGTVSQVSFCDVVEGRVKPEDLADRVVLVGATAPGLYDVRPAPYAARAHFYLGVETNAAVCRTLLEGPTLRDASGSLPWLLLAGLLATAAVLTVWAPAQSLVGVPAGLGILLLQAGGFLAAFYWANLVLPWGPAAVATAVPWAWSAYRRLGVERSVIRDQFAAYVSPDVLAELMRNPQVLQRGERREVTLLFSDIRGSTALAERMPPEQWIAQLNEYLTAMADAVLSAHGYLDKFMGDGIMAVWNAFGDQPHHADLAVLAAEAMLQRLQELNRQWADRPDRAPLRIGIGLHTGEAIIGNVGSEERTQFTAIGDAVNAASRIEGMTKELQVQLVISEATKARLGRDVALAALGEVTLRGRETPVKLFGPSEAREVGTHVGQAQAEAED